MHMLDYQKLILKKVSFNPELFRKELIKSKKYLSHSEKLALKKWCIEQFDAERLSIITDCFKAKSNQIKQT